MDFSLKSSCSFKPWTSRSFQKTFALWDRYLPPILPRITGSPDNSLSGSEGQEVSIAASGLAGIFLATRFTLTLKQTSVRADSSNPRRPSIQTKTSCRCATQTIRLRLNCLRYPLWCLPSDANCHFDRSFVISTVGRNLVPSWTLRLTICCVH